MEHTNRPPSPPGSNTSSDEVVNTSDQRVYSEPLSSSEKNHIALVDPPISEQCLNESDKNQPLPRRSPSLSQSDDDSAEEVQRSLEQSTSEQEDDQEERVALVQNQLFPKTTWDEEPYQELVLLRDDEPSSAIASRIMRAHDNPSPPPKAIRPSSTPRRLSKPLVFPLISTSEESSDAAIETPSPPQLTEDVSTPTPSIFSASQTISTSDQHILPPTNIPTIQSPPNFVDDLISFDRSVIINSSDNTQIRSPSPRRLPQRSQTVDDLLFLSPPHLIQSNVGLPTSEQEKITAVVSGPLVDLDQSVEYVSEKRASPSKLHSPSAEPCLIELSSTNSDVLPGPPPGSSEGSCQTGGISESQLTPANSLSVPKMNSSLRRSPRLSSIPIFPDNKTESPLEKETKGMLPIPESSKKRRRDGLTQTPRMSLTPKRPEWVLNSDSSESEADHLMSPTRKPRRDRKRVKKSEEVSSAIEKLQLVDSLSPGSAETLTKLISSEQKTSNMQSDNVIVAPSTPPSKSLTPTKEEGPSNPPFNTPIISSVQRPPPGIFGFNLHTPRGHSGVASSRMFGSPAKLTLMPALDNPNRTPARRIPISKASSSTQVTDTTIGLRQPQASTSAFTFPVQTTSNLTRSPAKRPTLPSETTINGSESQRETLDTTRTLNPISRSRIASARPSLAPASTRLSKPSTNTTSRLNPPRVGPLLKQNAGTLSSSSSSNPVGTSRIPRPGTTSSKISRLPTPAPRNTKVRGLSASRPSSTIADASKQLSLSQSSSSNCSDDNITSQSSIVPPAGSKPPRTLSQVKRRKALEKAPPVPRPMIRARQVIPGMFGGPVKSEVSNNAEKNPVNQIAPSPIKPGLQQRQLIPREVVKGTLQDFTLQSSSSKALEAISEARARERAAQEQAAQEKLVQERAALEKIEQERAEREKEAAESTRAESDIEEKMDVETEVQHPLPSGPSLDEFTFECLVPVQPEVKMDVDEHLPSENLLSSDDIIREVGGSRRSTRNRRSLQPTDVFGTVPAASAPATNTTRRTQAASSRPPRNSLGPNFVFHVNGIALKNLTINNTTRNQQYHSNLEVNVIRKAGNRPESPTMKLQTILEKQKDAQDRMRTERARRRRGESVDNTSTDVRMEEQVGEQSTKHRRGPGDEEDYETPVRPSTRKGVKWDRDLGVSVYLDEIEVQPDKRRNLQSTAPSKSCLSVKAPLDGSGNLLNMETPLNLAPETVVVTKFVYDNDLEAQVIEPPKTRTKAKKR